MALVMMFLALMLLVDATPSPAAETVEVVVNGLEDEAPRWRLRLAWLLRDLDPEEITAWTGRMRVRREDASVLERALVVGRRLLDRVARGPSEAELYDLACLRDSVQNRANNYTRFICISKKLEIYPGADKTSIMMALPHRPGSLYAALGRFYAQGVNLSKLESRPLPNSDFEFMFYFDLETSVYSDAFLRMLTEAEEMSTVFKYLGSYSEVI